MRDHKADQVQVVNWAKRLIESGNFVVLDTETTGFPPNCHPCEVGIIASDGSTLVAEILKPPVPISDGAARVHGITNAMVADKPTYADIHERVLEAVRGKIIVAYNKDFDRPVMHMATQHAGVDPIADFARWTCAMVAFAQWNGDWNSYHGNYKWVKLDAAARAMGVKLDEQTHRAVDDCILTLKVIQALANGGKPVQSQQDDAGCRIDIQVNHLFKDE